MSTQEPVAHIPESSPLAGVTVVDMTTSYAGPTATMYLADMGAEVIKVERPVNGDDCRSWGPPFRGDWSAWYVSANRNKRSLALDVASNPGRAVLDRLLAKADVFVQNVNPAKLVKLRLDAETVRADHAHLIYCAISGFGLVGDDRDLPGYDLIAQARSGLMSVTGAAGGLPQRVSTALTDIVTGITAAFAISAALVRRGGHPSPGSTIDIGLLDVALALVSPRITSYLAGEPEPRPSGATDSVLSIYQTFETLDRPIALAVGNDPSWRRLCQVLGLDSLGSDTRYQSNEGRRQARSHLVGAIQEVLYTRPSEEWLDLISGAGVPVAPVNYLSDVVADPHVKSRGSLTTLEIAGLEPFGMVTHPWRFGGVKETAPADPPRELGADTIGILQDLGFAMAEIAALTEAGVVGRNDR